MGPNRFWKRWTSKRSALWVRKNREPFPDTLTDGEAHSRNPPLTAAVLLIRSAALRRRRAHEIVRVSRAADSFVMRDLGIRTQRPCHVDATAVDARGADLVRRSAGFAPAFQRRDEVCLIGPHAAAPTPRARHKNQPQRFIRFAAMCRAHLGVVVDRIRGRWTGTGPTVIEEQLPPPSLEFREIGVFRFHLPAVFHRQREV